MQRFIYFSFIAVTLLEFLSKGDKWGRFKVLPGAMGYLFELLCALVLVLVIVLGVRSRFRDVRPVYWLVFMAFVVVMICGAVANAVDSGPIFAGIRSYFRAMPWFFLPAVWAFSSDQVRSQLKLLLAICLLQLPMAIEQRIKTGESRMGFTAVTGDWTVGTLLHGGILSIFLVAAVCIVAAMYERGRIRLTHFVLLFVALLLPTMINETKAMIVFLPVGLLAAFLCATRPELRAKRVVLGVGMLVFFAAIWLPVYNLLTEGREYGVSLEEFFTSKGPGTLDQYMTFGGGVGTASDEVGRGVAIQVMLQEISRDPVRLGIGLGIGNVSHSSLGTEFSGAYESLYGLFATLTFTRVGFELGLVGIVLLFWLYWAILEDCRVLARTHGGLMSDLAAGWAGVVLLMAATTFYAQLETFSSLSLPFWYFSGLIAAERMRLAAANGPLGTHALSVPKSI